jgi:Ca2+-transporting ATPase
MITGDQSATAYAIGRQLNLSGERRLDLIDSTELEKIDPDVLKSLAQEVEVFSAVTPSHKLEIVQALQRAGLVVAMTGDGINDGPALRAADIGVAMGGAAGTEVARRTADVILEDDNLHTMVEAIAQGRTIYGNTRNAIRYLLATNLSEILFMFAGVAGGFGSPLNAMQLLWINLVSDIFPVLALAIQPAEPDVLEWAPRDPHEPFLASSDMGDMLFQSSTITAGTMASYAWGRWRYGTPTAASTMAFTTITAAQLFQMVSSRSSDHSLFSHNRPTNNAFLNWALVGGLALQLITVVAPPLRRLLRNATLTPTDVAAGLLSAAAPVLVNEAVKEIRLRTRTHEPSAAIGDVLFPQGSSR